MFSTIQSLQHEAPTAESIEEADETESNTAHHVSNRASNLDSTLADAIYALDSQLNSILHLAAQKRSLQFVERVVEYILARRLASSLLTSYRNQAGETCTHVACANGCLEMVFN